MSRKLISSLSKKKYRDRLGLFIAEGLRFVSDIPEHVTIEMYACTEAFLSSHEFPFRQGIRKLIYDESIFKNLTDTVTPQGILAVCEKPKYDLLGLFDSLNNDTFIITDGIKDPGNLGTIVRIAASAGVKAVFSTEGTVDLYNPKVLRSTMGAVFRVPVIMTGQSIFDTLRSSGVTIIGTSPKAAAIYYDTKLSGNIAVIIGHEAKGMSDIAAACCHKHVSIPVENGCESLNAAVAAAVIIYETLRQKNRGI